MLRLRHFLCGAIMVLVIVCGQINFVVVVCARSGGCRGRIRSSWNGRYFHAKTTTGIISGERKRRNEKTHWIFLYSQATVNAMSTHLRTLNCVTDGALRFAESSLLELLLFDDESDACCRTISKNAIIIIFTLPNLEFDGAGGGEKRKTITSSESDVSDVSQSLLLLLLFVDDALLVVFILSAMELLTSDWVMVLLLLLLFNRFESRCFTALDDAVDVVVAAVGYLPNRNDDDDGMVSNGCCCCNGFFFSC